MPNPKPEENLLVAQAAVEFAQEVRKHHRRRSERNSHQRQEDIALALKRIRDAMRPLRSELGRFPYNPGADTERQEKIKAASQALQKERRKLWKMRPREPS